MSASARGNSTGLPRLQSWKRAWLALHLRWNHNTSRISEVLEGLLSEGLAVQLDHDEKETTWEKHGFVRVVDGDDQVDSLSTASFGS